MRRQRPTRPPVRNEAEQSSKAGLLNTPGTIAMALATEFWQVVLATCTVGLLVTGMSLLVGLLSDPCLKRAGFQQARLHLLIDAVEDCLHRHVRTRFKPAIRQRAATGREFAGSGAPEAKPPDADKPTSIVKPAAHDEGRSMNEESRNAVMER